MILFTDNIVRRRTLLDESLFLKRVLSCHCHQQGLAAACEFVDEWPLLIVVPSSMRYPWIDALEKWLACDFVRPGEVRGPAPQQLPLSSAPSQKQPPPTGEAEACHYVALPLATCCAPSHTISAAGREAEASHCVAPPVADTSQINVVHNGHNASILNASSRITIVTYPLVNSPGIKSQIDQRRFKVVIADGASR